MGLQHLINICANYGFENDILFNRSKSVCMVVKPSDHKNSTPLMYRNGVELEYVDRAEYLGVLLSQGMKDDADMNTHLRSFYARSNVIFRKFHHCSASIKVNLIKTYCAPYCSQLWVNNNNNNKQIDLQPHRVGFTYTVIYKQNNIQGNTMRRNVIRKVIHTATQRDTQSDTYFH